MEWTPLVLTLCSLSVITVELVLSSPASSHFFCLFWRKRWKCSQMPSFLWQKAIPKRAREHRNKCITCKGWAEAEWLLCQRVMKISNDNIYCTFPLRSRDDGKESYSYWHWKAPGSFLRGLVWALVSCGQLLEEFALSWSKRPYSESASFLALIIFCRFALCLSCVVRLDLTLLLLGFLSAFTVHKCLYLVL